MPLSKKAPKVEVYFDGILQPNARCLSASLTSGGNVLPHATIELIPAVRGKGRRQFLNKKLKDMAQSEVEVVVTGSGAPVVAHWGKLLAEQSQIDQQGEAVRLISRIEPHHFGKPLYKRWDYSPAIGKPAEFALPIVFNPQVDGITIGNKSSKSMPGGVPLFIDPEASRTKQARKYNQSEANTFWSLADAVIYLCETLNKDEKHIKNPDTLHLLLTLNTDTSNLRNHELPVGEYLPSLLDNLLAPYGFGWFVQFTASGRREIRFFERGKGEPGVIKMQAPGSDLDMNKSTAEGVNITFDASSRAFNEVLILGDYKRYEATFELVRGWKPEHDEYDIELLSRNNDEWIADPSLQRVWRDWVLNEAGDYNGTRPDIKGVAELGKLFGKDGWIPRRRKFEPCITHGEDGAPMGGTGGVYVEWWEPAGEDGGAWRPIDDLSSEGRGFLVLERECGIRFDGVGIPEEIWMQGSKAKVRVTATLASDERIEYRKTEFPFSVLGELKTETIDAGSRFKFRQRSKLSVFHKDYDGKGETDTSYYNKLRTDSQQDDTSVMESLATRLLTNWNMASIDGTITLTGVDFDFAKFIGRTISKIEGREVNLNCRSFTAADTKFPSVVGAQIDFMGQATTVTLDTYRQEVGI